MVDNILLYNKQEMLSNYFNTLKQTGYLPIQKAYEILLYDVVINILKNEDYLIYLSPKKQKQIDNIRECIENNNCLIQFENEMS